MLNLVVKLQPVLHVTTCFGCSLVPRPSNRGGGGGGGGGRPGIHCLHMRLI